MARLKFHYLFLLSLIFSPHLFADESDASNMLVYYQIALVLMGVITGVVFSAYMKQVRKLKALEASEDDLIEIAYFDPLTELPNAKNIETILSDQISRCQRHEKSFYIASINIINYDDLLKDHTKSLLDTFIIELSDTLYNAIRREDMVGHVKDREFLIIFNEYLDDGYLDLIFERIRDAITAKREIEGETLQAEVTIGVSRFATDANSAKPLIASAEEASHHNKAGEIYSLSRS
jgi:diguanylate cyclase (GGDEF)-like protein